ncbi:MAG TPA: nucleotide sugar dehydrogenase, partial [Caldimonas sp.]|nr:nucleotide sugar dehydrogenase [Caldimonas sp.]
AVSLACLARDGHRVIGVDVDETKLALIASGKTPVVEEGMVELMARVVQSGLLSVTTDAAQALRDSEVSLLCVGTPSAPNGSQDQSAVLRLAEQLGHAMRDIDRPHVFVFRSTLVPGTVEDVLRPILEKASGKREGRDFFVCFQPEFLREGSSIRDYDRPPFTIVGANAQEPVDRLRALFGHLPCQFHVTSVRAAETVKYCCNNFHALKITFANETARLCEALGVDPFEVMDLVCRDTQLNISPAYLRPGFAFGGSCLPKDLRATLHLAKRHDVELPMLAGILASNRAHVDLAVRKVLDTKMRRVAMIGLAFKTGTDDLRESPLVTVAEQLIGKGLSLLVYDPEVHLSSLLGANRRFIEEHLPHIGALIRRDMAAVTAVSDVLLVGSTDKATLKELRRLAEPRHVVIDLAHIADASDIAASYVGLAWGRSTGPAADARRPAPPERGSGSVPSAAHPSAVTALAGATPPAMVAASSAVAPTVPRGAARAIPATGRLDLTPTREELQAIFDVKYHQEGELGPGPRTRISYGYFNPDDHYEAIVSKLLQPGDAWADVGCGRDIFPSNRPLARQLAARSSYLYGVDPDPNIRDNPFITEGFEGLVEDCTTTRRFDLVTMRMVAEHIVYPARSLSRIADMLKPGGLLVVYTPNKWSPVPILTRLVPNAHHQKFKRMLWDTQERDTFPTAFRMNTRRHLRQHCAAQNLEEAFFTHLDDCRTFDSYRWLNHAELALQRLLRSVSIRYPENCLLGVYRKAAGGATVRVPAIAQEVHSS